MHAMTLIRRFFAELQAASQDNRGQIATVLGGTGAADYSAISQKQDDESYEWMQLAVTDGATLTPDSLTVPDASFTIQDNADPTKQARFQVSGVSAGQTRTYTLPNASSTLVDLGSSQTLQNKTMFGGSLTLLAEVTTASNNVGALVINSGGFTERFRVDSTTGYVVFNAAATIRSGTGDPEGVVAAPVGSLFLRSDGGTGTTLYVKETGAATSSGWVAK
jgi:hypothetical protein